MVDVQEGHVVLFLAQHKEHLQISTTLYIEEIHYKWNHLGGETSVFLTNENSYKYKEPFIGIKHIESIMSGAVSTQNAFNSIQEYRSFAYSLNLFDKTHFYASKQMQYLSEFRPESTFCFVLSSSL